MPYLIFTEYCLLPVRFFYSVISLAKIASNEQKKRTENKQYSVDVR